ncbi:MAG: hypothetical protein E6I75_18065, partial [Chloroflexi bacterium]
MGFHWRIGLNSSRSDSSSNSSKQARNGALVFAITAQRGASSMRAPSPAIDRSRAWVGHSRRDAIVLVHSPSAIKYPRFYFAPSLIIEPNRETIASFLNRWLRAYVDSNTAPKTRMYYTQVIRQHVIPRLGNKKLQDLRPIDLLETQHYWLAEGWLRTKTRRGLSPKSVANMNHVLHEAFRHAV